MLPPGGHGASLPFEVLHFPLRLVHLHTVQVDVFGQKNVICKKQAAREAGQMTAACSRDLLCSGKAAQGPGPLEGDHTPHLSPRVLGHSASRS